MSIMDNPIVKVALGLTVILVIAGLSIAASIEGSLQTAAVTAAPFLTFIGLEWVAKTR